MSNRPIFRSAFASPEDVSGGKRPVVFDILGPDRETSLLPEGMRMVLHVNPQNMSIKYQRVVTRIQTRGGHVEQHWGDGVQTVDFDMVTGGFMRLYTGLASGATLGGRRETIAYDKYLDLLALFHNNGSIEDSRGNIVLQGIIKITFDGGVWLGWFNGFNVIESSDKPYMFQLSTSFEVEKELVTWRTTYDSGGGSSSGSSTPSEYGQPDFLR